MLLQVASYVSYNVIDYTNGSLVSWIGVDYIKCVTMVNIMKNINKSNISSRDTVNIDMFEVYFNMFTLSVLKGISQKYIFDTYGSEICVSNWILFSFVFEIIFDFWHYWIHRILHSHRILYQYIHKKHHKYCNPSAEVTFYMSVFDLILGHCFPLILTSYILNCYLGGLYKFHLIKMNIYLSYIEVAGHIGKKMNPTSSFTQFVWFPRLLGIELYTEDHHLHHSKLNCNFSKRFNLWDRIFGTFASGL